MHTYVCSYLWKKRALRKLFFCDVTIPNYSSLSKFSYVFPKLLHLIYSITLFLENDDFRLIHHLRKIFGTEDTQIKKNWISISVDIKLYD